jgi:hypothetical protein
MFPNKSTVLLSSKSFDLEYQSIFCPSRSGSSMALGVNKIVISFVSSKAVSCDYKLNPFNFNHYDLSEISLLVDRIPVGGNAMKINFKSSIGI